MEPTLTSQRSGDEQADRTPTIIIKVGPLNDCIVEPCEPRVIIGKQVAFQLHNTSGSLSHVAVRIDESWRPLIVSLDGKKYDTFFLSPDIRERILVITEAHTKHDLHVPRGFVVEAWFGDDHKRVEGKRDESCPSVGEESETVIHGHRRPRMIVQEAN